LRQINDPGLVREQYAREDNLRARQSIYANAEGPDAREIAFDAVAETRPIRVLEVGGGQGELAERLSRELGVELTLVDQSERMVEIARERGLDAQVGDVQRLAFGDGSFDCAIAAWMLYHVQDVDLAVAELARVLKPGGRLVAVTNGAGHLRELRELARHDCGPRGLSHARTAPRSSAAASLPSSVVTPRGGSRFQPTRRSGITSDR